MTRVLPFLLTLTFISLCSVAQETAKPFRKGTYIKVNPTTIINELDVYLEQDLSQKLSLELGVGGIYTDYPDYVFMKRIDIGQRKPGVTAEQFVEGRGLGFRAGLKWYLVRPDAAFRARGTYFQPVLFYKKVFYPYADVTYGGQIFREDGDKNVYGLQLLLGRQMQRNKFVIDPYLGIGLRRKVYHYTDFSGGDGSPIVRSNGELASILPSIHLGIKVGLKL